MKTMLVTGGTIFVSQYIAQYYVEEGYEVYVLNRNSREQSAGVKLIEADRHNLGETLRNHHFDVIVDTAYSSKDVNLLLDAVGSYDDYVLISSSAVYPEYEVQPFSEECNLGVNKYWGKYGTDKIEAEQALQKRNPNAYIVRPPYLYGPLNNVYREAFVFDCAMNDRKFYLPQNGEMTLHFFHIDDLCRFIDVLLVKKPKQKIFNVGNAEVVSIRQWVEICYEVVGKNLEVVNVWDNTTWRSYFSFTDYEYSLDISKQSELMSETKSLKDGLVESYNWYKDNTDKVNRKSYMEYIDSYLSVKL